MPVGVVPQVSGYSLQLRAEDECFNTREAVLKPVYELKKDLTVKVHRPRNVAHHDQPGLLLFAPLEREPDELSSVLQRLSKGSAQINSEAAPGGLPSAAGNAREPPGDPPRHSGDFLKLIGAEQTEVFFRIGFSIARAGQIDRLRDARHARAPVFEKESQPLITL